MKYGFPPAKLAAIGLLVSFSDSNSVSDTVALTECGQPAVDRRPFRRRVRLLGLEKKDTEEKPTIVNFQDGATKPTICFQEHNYSFYSLVVDISDFHNFVLSVLLFHSRTLREDWPHPFILAI